MKNSKFLFIFMVLFLGASFFIAQKLKRPEIFISKQDQTLNLNNKITQYFHLGQKRLLSSAMWIATILESDIEHYKKKDTNSWMYLRFKTISDLEPKFYENYQVGAVWLSIVKDDLEGASEIYMRGLKEYPNDYFLLKNAAFHFEFEVGDSKKAHEIYTKLRIHPQVDALVLGIATRLETEFGSKEIAFTLLKSHYDNLPERENVFRKLLSENLYALKAEIDLECLNSKRTGCSNLDFNGNPYVYFQGYFTAKETWKPFRLNRKQISR